MRFRLGTYQVESPLRWERYNERRHAMNSLPRTRTWPIWSSIDTGRAEDPDLLDALPRGEADRRWLEWLRDELGDPDAKGYGKGLRLTCCDFDEDEGGGVLSIAAVDYRRRYDVRLGDVVHAGFAATSHHAGTVTIAPRIFRVACTNGAITELGIDHQQSFTDGDLRQAVQACLSGERFQGELNRLQKAATLPIPDPEGALQSVRARSSWPEVRAAHAQERDNSLWGLINAVTAHARSAPTWAERLEREADAAALLELLPRRPLRPNIKAERAMPREAADQPLSPGPIASGDGRAWAGELGRERTQPMGEGPPLVPQR